MKSRTRRKDKTKDLSRPSLLERLFKLLEEQFPLRINFEDLTGVTLDVPDIQLPGNSRIHACDFCMFAKSNLVGHQDCIRNKMAVNRLARWRREKFQGQCHLGLTDLVRPLLLEEQLLGVFYYGSVVLEGTEATGRSRIRKYCRLRSVDPKPFLQRFDEVPRLSLEELSTAWRNLDLVADTTLRLLESIGVPLEHYRTRAGAQFMAWNSTLPAIVGCTIRYINANYGEQLRVNDLAVMYRCHPDYLSRVFKKSVGIGINEYLHQIRIGHAQKLLEVEKFSVGEISFIVGYCDQSHFGKVFRQRMGMAPAEYRSRVLKKTKQAGINPTPIDYFEYSSLHEFTPRIRRKKGAAKRRRGS